MNKNKLTILIVIGIFVSIFSCRQKDNWFQETKNKILIQSKLETDSTALTFNEDSTFRKEHFYKSGHEYLMKGFKKGILRLEIHYSLSSKFELRREICDNGNFGFEGIFYKDKAYGQSTWRNCNGKLQEQGIRFNGEKIGQWKKWNENGELVEETENGNEEQIDSMPILEMK